MSIYIYICHVMLGYLLYLYMLSFSIYLESCFCPPDVGLFLIHSPKCSSVSSACFLLSVCCCGGSWVYNGFFRFFFSTLLLYWKQLNWRVWKKSLMKTVRLNQNSKTMKSKQWANRGWMVLINHYKHHLYQTHPLLPSRDAGWQLYSATRSWISKTLSRNTSLWNGTSKLALPLSIWDLLVCQLCVQRKVFRE